MPLLNLLNSARRPATPSGSHGNRGLLPPDDAPRERDYGRLATLLAIIIAILALLMLTGCGSESSVSVQRVYNLERAQRRPIPMRTLAALVPHDGQVWFFKVTGPDSRVGSYAEEFEQFLSSIKFEDGKPTWTVPEGWIELGSDAGQLRFATFKLGQRENAPELTVIPLPTQEAVDETYILANINRWRNQLNLPALTPGELAANTVSREIGGEQGTVVNMVGRSTFDKIAARPFAGGGMGRPRGDAPVAAPGGAMNEPEQGSGAQMRLVYDTPEGWKPGQLNQFRKAAFDIVDGDRKALVTVIDLGPEAGDAMSNINRWRGQIGLGPITPQDLEKDLQRIDIGEHPAVFIEMVGPQSPDQQTILGAITLIEGRPWFFKLQGDSSLAAEQKDAFLKFLKSARFEKQ